MAYTTAALVAAYLGRAFSAAQNTEATLLIAAAQAQIDALTGKTWEPGATVSNEDHWYLDGALIWLRNTPVTAITSVTRRDGISDTTLTTLTAGTDYELQDAATGRVYIPGWATGDRYRITYTTPNAVDADIALATKMLVGFWMTPLLEGAATPIKSVSVSGELSVSFQDVATEQGMPASVMAILKRKRRGLVFA